MTRFWVLFAALIFASDTMAESAEKIAWILNCQGCHRADGGQTSDQVPPLRGNVARFLKTPAGREFLIRVPGVAMAPLNDAAVARLTNWMLQEFDAVNLPKDAPPFSEKEVARLRQRPLSNEAASVRAIVLQEIEQLEKSEQLEK